MQYPYPSLPSYVAAPKREEIYPTLPAAEPQMQPAKLQPMEMMMPVQSLPRNDVYMRVGADDYTPLIVMILSCLLAYWVIMFTILNVSTFFYLIGHPTLNIVLICIYFAASFCIKVNAIIVGFMASCKSASAEALKGALIWLFVNAGGFVVFLLWSWSNLSTGTNIGLIVGFALHAGVVVLSYIIGPKPTFVQPAFPYTAVMSFPQYYP